MIIGGSKDEHDHMQNTKFQLMLLLMNPVLISTGELAMRSMRKMPEAVVSLYMNFTLGITMYFAIKLSGGHFDTWGSFDLLDWLAIISLSTTVLLSQILRFKALQNHKASALQPWAFINPVYQFIADTLLFGNVFTFIQMVGLSIVVAVYAGKLVYNYVSGDK